MQPILNRKSALETLHINFWTSAKIGAFLCSGFSSAKFRESFIRYNTALPHSAAVRAHLDKTM